MQKCGTPWMKLVVLSIGSICQRCLAVLLAIVPPFQHEAEIGPGLGQFLAQHLSVATSDW